MTKQQLYRDAKAALAEASRLEEGMKASGQQLNAARWRLAEDIAQLYELGDSQRVIAETLGIAQARVSNYLRIWTDHEDDHARDRLDFGECLKEVRGGWGHEPTTTEKRAERAAGYLSDREVWKDPVVQETMRAQVRRDIREETKAPTPPKETGRTNLTVVTGSYWEIALAKMVETTRIVREAIREIDRSGMPNVQSGALIRQARALAAAAQELEHRLSDTAVGKSTA